MPRHAGQHVPAYDRLPWFAYSEVTNVGLQDYTRGNWRLGLFLESTDRGVRTSTLLLVLGFLALNVYRGATQSITMDEAYTYLSFVKPPLVEILTRYDANHHVLHSLLCKASTALFGVSELTLRLPSLIGGMLYCLSALAICRLLLGRRWSGVLCLAILITNPLVLDFSSVARGYSLGMGFLFLGIWGLLLELGADITKRQTWRRPVLLGVSFGLSVSSVLTFAFPVAACICVFTIFAFTSGSGAYKKRVAELTALVASALAVAFAINIGPLSRARRESFAIGFGSIFETLKNSLYSFLRHHQLSIGFGGWRADPFDWLYPVCRFAVLLVFALAVMLLCAHALSPRARFLRREAVFLDGLLVAIVALLVAAHRCLGIAYPVARTAIYFLPLAALAIAASIGASRGTGLRIARLSFGALGLMLLAQFITQLNVTYYGPWLFDAGTRQVARFLVAQPAKSQRVKITATWTLVPCLNFYREMYRLAAWQAIEGVNGDVTLESGDYVVFDNSAAASMPQGRLKPVLVDRLSGAVVATHRN
jgi:4-amino-4-deoxy-L-arabinose transferase-like glycosyltransferase